MPLEHDGVKNFRSLAFELEFFNFPHWGCVVTTIPAYRHPSKVQQLKLRKT
jgi:hypothetical protein